MTLKTYLVADGVQQIAGAPVPDDRKVKLTDSQALYDLCLGRITLAVSKKPGKSSGGKAD